MNIHSANDYKLLLKSLMPSGRALPKDLGTQIDNFLAALGDELTLIDIDSEDLLTESIPSLTEVLVDDHEKDFDIDNSDLTISERRVILKVRETRRGNQIESYFIDYAEDLGYIITIECFKPAWAGVMCAGDTCGDQWILFIWLVWVCTYDPDDSYDGINDLEYYQRQTRSMRELIDEFYRIRAAHGHPVFLWGDVGFTRGFGPGFLAAPSNDDSIPIWTFNSGFSTGFAAQHDYDGEELTGGFSNGFSVGCSAYIGGGFLSDGFSTGFLKPV